jgi:hypothetical protein
MRVDGMTNTVRAIATALMIVVLFATGCTVARNPSSPGDSSWQEEFGISDCQEHGQSLAAGPNHDLVNRVTYGNERIVLTSRRKPKLPAFTTTFR